MLTSYTITVQDSFWCWALPMAVWRLAWSPMVWDVHKDWPCGQKCTTESWESNWECGLLRTLTVKCIGKIWVKRWTIYISQESSKEINLRDLVYAVLIVLDRRSSVIRAMWPFWTKKILLTLRMLQNSRSATVPRRCSRLIMRRLRKLEPKE